ncbi:hypothetical protein QR685DRAFT_535244 [Neurospora intermedia]|uniref:RNase H type-1 domain-containing protein n=1 Tax=Neurospora intermedia TaxID=5142 RepID=A0ABR3D3V4_NEUIN
MQRRFASAAIPFRIKWSVGATGMSTRARCQQYTAPDEEGIQLCSSTLHLSGNLTGGIHISVYCLFRLVPPPSEVAHAPSLEPHFRPRSAFFDRLRCHSPIFFSFIIAGYYPSLQPLPRNDAGIFTFGHMVANFNLKRTSSTMETPSAEDTIPPTRDDDQEYAISQVERYPGEPEVAHTRHVFTRAHSARTGNHLLSQRSPSPVADQRVLLWKNENRSFKGIIDRDRTRPDRCAAVARAAQKSALMVGGKPQFVFFCDGSSAYRTHPNSTQDGGYAVVFRDPYGADKATTVSASNLARAEICLTGPREEDDLNVDDFTIRCWLSHRTFGAAHVEMAALAQALEEVIKRNDQYRPDTSTVKIFTDSETALARISRGILNLETNTFANSLKRKRENKAFFEEHTNPFVRLIVWQSHYLFDHGCTVKMIWMPRNTTLGHRLADHMAGKWKGKGPSDDFNQKYLPHDQRDGVLDKLHEDVGAIERARVYDVVDSQKHQTKEREIERAAGVKRRNTIDRIALLDSPSDYILLDSDSEGGPKLKQAQPSKITKKIRGATTAKQRSTTDYILLDSDSDEEPQRPKKRRRVKRARVQTSSARDQIAVDNTSDCIAPKSESENQLEPKQPQPSKKKRKIKGEIIAKQGATSNHVPRVSVPEQKPKPKPQPPKKRQEIKDAIVARQRSTSDFILLDSESEEQPEVKPQTPKKRKKIRGAIPPKKKAPMQQQAEIAAAGFLNGQDHDFAFDSGNLPSFPIPSQKHAIHDP